MKDGCGLGGGCGPVEVEDPMVGGGEGTGSGCGPGGRHGPGDGHGQVMGVAALPKGCMIKHRSLAANAHAMVGCFGLTTGERFWDPMPMFHLTSLLPMHSCFATEATFASMSHFHPDVAMDLLDTKLRAVVYSCFPPVTMAIYHHPLCQVGVLGWANGILEEVQWQRRRW
jgi:hypothetical protein